MTETLSGGLRSKTAEVKGPWSLFFQQWQKQSWQVHSVKGDKQWVGGHPHKPLLVCLVIFIEYHEDTCSWAWTILFGEIYCLASAFSSLGTFEAYFCISSLIDVCLFSVRNVDIALCMTLSQKYWDEIMWIFT